MSGEVEVCVGWGNGDHDRDIFLRKERVFGGVICIVDLCQIRLLYFLGKIKV